MESTAGWPEKLEVSFTRRSSEVLQHGLTIRVEANP